MPREKLNSGLLAALVVLLVVYPTVLGILIMLTGA